MGISIQVLNAKELQKALHIKKDNILKDSITIVQEGGILLKEEIQSSIAGQRNESRSVDTGAFLNSITSDNTELGADVSTDLPYPVFLEYGTSRIEERRHFRNSLERTTPIILKNVKEVIHEVLKQ